jgi:hypothetical protein
MRRWTTRADAALEALRPRDPLVLARWLRWWATPIGGASDEVLPVLEHVADRLEALGGRASS